MASGSVIAHQGHQQVSSFLPGSSTASMILVQRMELITFATAGDYWDYLGLHAGRKGFYCQAWLRHDEPLHHTCFDVQIQSDNKCLDDLSMDILQPVDLQGPLGTFVAGRILHYTHYKYIYI